MDQSHLKTFSCFEDPIYVFGIFKKLFFIEKQDPFFIRLIDSYVEGIYSTLIRVADMQKEDPPIKLVRKPKNTEGL